MPLWALNRTNSAIADGTVAFSGADAKFDNVKVGYDNNSDDDINDAGDDLVWDENFGSTSVTVSHDHAGNLIDDGMLRYTHDAWNRLIKVQQAADRTREQCKSGCRQRAEDGDLIGRTAD
jgi:hypothetical protein